MKTEDKTNVLSVAGDQVIAESAKQDEMFKWVGRHQAFGLNAAQNAAAQAECLKRIKESGGYRDLGVSWDEFCVRELGIPRRTADHIISQLEEFGASYFAMSSVVRISAATYRLAAGSVTDAGMEIDGEIVPLTKANAERIAEAVNAIRKEAESKAAQLTESKAELEKARRERDGARTAAKNLETALAEARAKEANRYKAATPNGRLLIEADEAMRYATARVERVLASEEATDSEKDLAREFAFQAVKAFYTSCGITQDELFFADAIPAGRSPLDEHLAAQPEVKAALSAIKGGKR